MSPKPRILCVDDEPGVLEALTRLLKEHFEVLSAGCAEEAFEISNTTDNIAIFLSDYRMPGKNGIEFLRSARQIHPFAARAILSGQMDINDLTEAINKAEIHRFILKPWENEYLKLQMLEILQLHSSLVEKGQLHLQAITDPVTRLSNHRYFQARLREEVDIAQTSGGSLSVVMIDVDHFKSFNDRYGHPEGDRLLAEIAQQIELQAGPKGVASRYGGEEFAVILPGVDLFEATRRADQMRQAIENSPFLGPFGKRAYVTVSLGVANYPVHSLEASALVRFADQALYQAKRQGRNQTVAAAQ